MAQDGAMTFPLMRGYDKINVVAALDPVAAARDAELGRRMRAHPKLFPAGSPDFGFAVQTGRTWRIGGSGGTDPEGARHLLAGHLRRRAAQQEEQQEESENTDETGEPDPRISARCWPLPTGLIPKMDGSSPRTNGRSGTGATE